MAPTSIDQGGDHRMRRAPARHTLFELGLPPVQRPPTSVRVRRTIGPIDELIRAADESVQGVHSRTHFTGQARGRPVVGGIVPALHLPTGPVGRPQTSIAFGIDACHLHRGSAGISGSLRSGQAAHRRSARRTASSMPSLAISC